MSLHRAEHLQDPGAELLDRAQGVWNRFGRITLIVLGVVVAGGALAFFGLRSKARTEEQAASRLADANLLFWQGDYKRSADEAKKISEQWPGSPSGNDAHRLAGDDAYWTGDFKTAAKEYKAFLAHAKPNVLANSVKRSLAYALECDKQYAEAVPVYVGLVGQFDRETSAEFLMAAARCEREAGRRPEAVKYLTRLVDEFGETSFANRARLEIAELSTAPH